MSSGTFSNRWLATLLFLLLVLLCLDQVDVEEGARPDEESEGEVLDIMTGTVESSKSATHESVDMKEEVKESEGGKEGRKERKKEGKKEGRKEGSSVRAGRSHEMATDVIEGISVMDVDYAKDGCQEAAARGLVEKAWLRGGSSLEKARDAGQFGDCQRICMMTTGLPDLSDWNSCLSSIKSHLPDAEDIFMDVYNIRFELNVPHACNSLEEKLKNPRQNPMKLCDVIPPRCRDVMPDDVVNLQPALGRLFVESWLPEGSSLQGARMSGGKTQAEKLQMTSDPFEGLRRCHETCMVIDRRSHGGKNWPGPVSMALCLQGIGAALPNYEAFTRLAVDLQKAGMGHKEEAKGTCNRLWLNLDRRLVKRKGDMTLCDLFRTDGNAADSSPWPLPYIEQDDSCRGKGLTVTATDTYEPFFKHDTDDCAWGLQCTETRAMGWCSWGRCTVHRCKPVP